jgi:hypothetical protein
LGDRRQKGWDAFTKASGNDWRVLRRSDSASNSYRFLSLDRQHATKAKLACRRCNQASRPNVFIVGGMVVITPHPPPLRAKVVDAAVKRKTHDLGQLFSFPDWRLIERSSSERLSHGPQISFFFSQTSEASF